MQKTLERLFEGKILPDEDMKIKIEGSKEIMDELDFDFNSLKKRLTDEQKEDVDYLVSETNEVSDMRAMQSFIDGFKMGGKIIMEVFIDDEDKQF